MPVVQTNASPDRLWGLWKITEDESALQRDLPLESVPPLLANPLKRLEFLAGRALIKALLNEWSLPYKGIEKDPFGKPFLCTRDVHISLSHSYPFVAAILHRNKNVGIDLEQPKDKLLRIAPRILSETELTDAGDRVVKHCVYWCAKETLIKIYGKKDLVFARDLHILPFRLEKEGHLIGRILANNTETTIPLNYWIYDSFVLVVST